MGKSFNLETSIAICDAYSRIAKELGIHQPNATPSQRNLDFTWSVKNVHIQLWGNV